MPTRRSYLPDDSSTPRAKKAAAKAKPAPKSSPDAGGKAKAAAKPAAKAKSTRPAQPAPSAKKPAPKSSLGARGKAAKPAPKQALASSPAAAATARRKPQSSLGGGGKAVAPKRAAARPAPEPLAAAPVDPTARASTPAPAPAAESAVRYVEVGPPPAPPSRREINEAIVLAVLAARREDDQTVLRRLLADDVALHLPSEDPIVGRDELLDEWERQADLLEEAAVFEADLRSLAGGDDHAFTYVETRTEAMGAPVTYTTLTAYRIRNGQVTEIRQHVDNHLGYLSFWRELEAAAGPTEAEVEPEPPRQKGFARFFR